MGSEAGEMGERRGQKEGGREKGEKEEGEGCLKRTEMRIIEKGRRKGGGQKGENGEGKKKEGEPLYTLGAVKIWVCWS